MNVRARRFPLMDSLRAVAALSLVAYHAGFFAGLYTSGSAFAPFAVQLGAFGVAVFFVISGFLLYRPFVRARLAGQPWPSTGAYAWRRFLRIVPPFWVAITAVAIWIGPDVWSARGAVDNYGFLQLYMGGATRDAIPQAWTLGVEVAFYSALPLWALAMRRLPRADARASVRVELGALGLLAGGGLAWVAIALRTDASTPVLTSLPGFADQFAIGMCLAVASVWCERERNDRPPRVLALLARAPSTSWLIALAALATCAWWVGLPHGQGEAAADADYVIRHVLAGVFAAALVLPAVFGDARSGAPRRILGNRALLFLGLVSYSVFLYHWAVLRQLARWKLGELDVLSPYVRWTLFAAAGTALVATVSYYAVERPALSLKRLVGPDPGRAQPGEALAEPAPATTISAR